MAPKSLLLVGVLAALLGCGRGSERAQMPLAAPAGDFVCRHPPYRVHMVSTSPLVMHISDFLTVEEREHLIRIRYLQLHSDLDVVNANDTQ